MTEINVLSLFDGVSCGQIALDRLNVNVASYYASELDKNPIKVATHNFPNTIHLGDVRGVNAKELPRIDVLLGGSPCTDLSVAGKQKGMSTTTEVDVNTLEQYLELKADGYEFEGESFLFWEYVRILTELRKANPDIKFLLENTAMNKKWKKVISDALGIAPITINSRLVSAQNRVRLYWANIKTESFGLFGEPYCAIPQPNDKGLHIRDILEKGPVSEKYYIKNPKFGFNAMSIDTKARTMRVGGKTSQSDKHNHDLISIPADFVKIDKKGNPKKDQAKASCFTAGAHSGGNHSDMDLILENPIVHSLQPRNGKGLGGKGHLQKNDGKSYCVDTGNGQAIEFPTVVAQRGRNPNNTSDRTAGSPTVQMYEPNTSGGSNCLTTVNKDNLLAETPSRIRRFTPVEVCRLQTISDTYFYDADGKQVVSDSAIYKACGNGWTIDVITHILSFANLPIKTT